MKAPQSQKLSGLTPSGARLQRVPTYIKAQILAFATRVNSINNLQNIVIQI